MGLGLLLILRAIEGAVVAVGEMLSRGVLLSGLFGRGHRHRPRTILLSMNSPVHGGLHIRVGGGRRYQTVEARDRRIVVGGTKRCGTEAMKRTGMICLAGPLPAVASQQLRQWTCMQGPARLQRSLATGWVGRQSLSACQHINARWLGRRL